MFNLFRKKIDRYKMADVVFNSTLENVTDFAESFRLDLINKVGFSEEHIPYKHELIIHLYLFSIALDVKSLYNLVDEKIASDINYYVLNNYFDYVSDEDIRMYYIKSIERYIYLFDKATENNEYFFDYCFTELINNILDDNAELYNINSIQMLQMIEMTLPFAIGTWKRVIDNIKAENMLIT